jgi:hypothetical protein
MPVVRSAAVVVDTGWGGRIRVFGIVLGERG